MFIQLFLNNMNPLRVKVISIISIAALIGLVGIQLHWISNAMELNRQRFEQQVIDALTTTATRLEKKSTAAKIKKRFNFRKQGIRWFMKDTNAVAKRLVGDTSIETPSRYRALSNQYKVKISESIETDSNGVIRKNSFERDYLTDSINDRDFSLGATDRSVFPFLMGKSDTISSSFQRFMNKSDIVNDIFDELVSINVYNDYNDNVDSLLLDTLLRECLIDNGIFTSYHYAVFNQSDKKVVVAGKDTTSLACIYSSPFRVNLSPNNIHIAPKILSIYFPNQTNYLLKNMWLMLLASSVFIFVLILFFYFTITTIFKQKKLSEIKNDFIGNMTHEFKTPISTISLACEVLNDNTVQKSKEKTEKYVEVINEENKRLGTLVENVLQTAILDKGEFKLKITEVDVHAIIEKAIDNIRLQVENKNGKLNTQLKADTSTIQADKVHLTNIIYNLIDNALKYTQREPEITVSTHSNQSGVFISVKDNGIGISKENSKKVFDTLFRVPTGNIHNVKGYGLGLSYVKAVVEKHGGVIELESELNIGSTFKIFLPYINKHG